MNRAERRRLLKNKNKNSDRSLKAVERSEISAAIDYTAKMYSAALALTLHDKLGFGKKRSQRLLNQVWGLFADIKAGYLTLDDVVETVQNELNIDLEDI